VLSSVLRQDEMLYKCDAYNYVVRQTAGGSYHRLIVQQGTNVRQPAVYSFLCNCSLFAT